jgi:hypothetical protein
MKIEVIQTTYFTKSVDDLLKKRQLLKDDFDSFLKELAKNPDKGDVVPGTSGVRKIRLKSASKGKSGGFRVCYYFYTLKGRIYLLSIYAKNDQENITSEEKKVLRQLAIFFKGDSNG